MSHYAGQGRGNIFKHIPSSPITGRFSAGVRTSLLKLCMECFFGSQEFNNVRQCWKLHGPCAKLGDVANNAMVDPETSVKIDFAQLLQRRRH